MQQYFITGTDTGVGKTIFSTVLSLGLVAKYWKPVQSGTYDMTDTQFVSQFNQNIKAESYVLKEPLSPNQSAELEGVRIDLKTINNHEKTNLVIEGAGGLFVPLNNEFYMIDLIKKMSLPCILVARSGLGTLNHTLLSLRYLRQSDIKIAGIVLNGGKNKSNKRDIEKYGGVPIILEQPVISKFCVKEFLNIYEQINFGVC